MQLLLTHGYFLADDPKELAIMKPYAPLGLLYLSSHLRARGFEVEIYDSHVRNSPGIIRADRTRTPTVVGIYGNLMTRANVLAIAGAARESGCRVILGGPEPANYPDEYLAVADAIVNGEGELSLEAFLSTTDLATVPGIQYRDAAGAICRTEPAAQNPESRRSALARPRPHRHDEIR